MPRSQNIEARYDTLFKSIDHFYQIDEMAKKEEEEEKTCSSKFLLDSWSFLFEVLLPFKRP